MTTLAQNDIWKNLSARIIAKRISSLEVFNLALDILKEFNKVNIHDFARQVKQGNLKLRLYYVSMKHLLRAKEKLVNLYEITKKPILKHIIVLMFGDKLPSHTAGEFLHYVAKFKHLLPGKDSVAIKKYMYYAKKDHDNFYLKLFLDELVLHMAKDHSKAEGIITPEFCDAFQEHLQRQQTKLVIHEKRLIGFKLSFITKLMLSSKTHTLANHLDKMQTTLEKASHKANDAAIVSIGTLSSLFKKNIYEFHMAFEKMVLGAKILGGVYHLFQLLFSMCALSPYWVLPFSEQEHTLTASTQTYTLPNALAIYDVSISFEAISENILDNFMQDSQNMKELALICKEELNDQDFTALINNGVTESKDSKNIFAILNEIQSRNPDFSKELFFAQAKQLV